MNYINHMIVESGDGIYLGTSTLALLQMEMLDLENLGYGEILICGVEVDTETLYNCDRISDCYILN
jgi:hypothetical protein